ncbi:MAG: flagellar biosynthetic protein FliR [Candidatus Carbobacillus altaicus]|nr:flagellar biosynthetic protein FliR [Candidatus Carbobacillus altaicus]
MLDWEGIVALLPYAVLIFFRLGAFMLVAPPFNLPSIPHAVKIALALSLSAIVVSVLGGDFVNQPLVMNTPSYLGRVIIEVLFGLSLGWVVYVFFSLFQTAGGIIDFQMGFAIANVIDPQTGAQSPLVGQFKYMLALFLLFITGGYRLMLQGVLNSFVFFPPAHPLMFDDVWVPRLVDWFVRVFTIGLEVAAPYAIVLFLLDLSLGLLSRAVPQMNMFVVGLPVKILGAMFMLALFLPFFIFLTTRLFDLLFETLSRYPAGLG